MSRAHVLPKHANAAGAHRVWERALSLGSGSDLVGVCSGPRGPLSAAPWARAPRSHPQNEASWVPSPRCCVRALGTPGSVVHTVGTQREPAPQASGGPPPWLLGAGAEASAGPCWGAPADPASRPARRRRTSGARWRTSSSATRDDSEVTEVTGGGCSLAPARRPRGPDGPQRSLFGPPVPPEGAA